MQSFLNRLFEDKSNVHEIACIFTELLDVSISSSTLKKEIEEHPNYPSLLSISDVLTNYGVENLCMSLEPDKLGDIPFPFIMQLNGKKKDIDFFTIVKDRNARTIHYFDPEEHKWVFSEQSAFFKRCSGIVLIAEAGEVSGEKDYFIKTRNERRQHLIQILLTLWFPSVVLAMGVAAFLRYGFQAISPLLSSLTALIGGFACFLLIWYELDEYSPVLRQICGISKKINCAAILKSKASKIAGISWSSIGFTYFTGMMLVHVFWGSTNPYTLFVSAIINLCTIPYIFYSVYYQWRIAKQWCALCLFVQGLLTLQFILALTCGWHTLLPLTAINIEKYVQLLTGFSIPFIFITVLMPALIKAKEKKYFFTELQRLKHDPQIFNALLEKQDIISRDPEGLGIIIGNPAATYKIIKVCNPYCSPCAKAHVPIEDLVRNNPDIQVQILFTATSQEDDFKTYPVRHLLAIAETTDEHITQQALNDWYLAEQKDYDRFAAKYPMNGELKKQIKKIDDMHRWCVDIGIAYTPTFFVSMSGQNGESSNYHKLPAMYNAADLKYFLSV